MFMPAYQVQQGAKILIQNGEATGFDVVTATNNQVVFLLGEYAPGVTDGDMPIANGVVVSSYSITSGQLNIQGIKMNLFHYLRTIIASMVVDEIDSGAFPPINLKRDDGAWAPYAGLTWRRTRYSAVDYAFTGLARDPSLMQFQGMEAFDAIRGLSHDKITSEFVFDLLKAKWPYI